MTVITQVKIVEQQKISIVKDMCIGCGLCAEVCPFGLPIEDGEGKYEILEVERCVECSACKKNCPTFAVRMVEQQGCGCLWDARSRRKNPNESCCG